MLTQALRPRLLIAVTHPMTARYLMAGQLAFLRDSGFDVSVACGSGEETHGLQVREGVRVLRIPMQREISPFADLGSLRSMVAAIRSLQPQIVNAGTPKAGLLGMMAAFIARAPIRIYTLRGLRFETTKGLQRHVLTVSERLAAGCAHRVVCVSESLRQRAVQSRLVHPSKAMVLGSGSSNGVDAARFSPASPVQAAQARRSLGIPEDAPVVGFVGRLTRDKGIADLVDVFFGTILDRLPDAHLLLVGGYEEGDPVPPEIRQRLEQDARVVAPGFVTEPERCYQAMSVLVFPSYREGFPNAPLEAAASGLPVAGFAATGTVDAVQDGRTGSLVPVGDTGGLSEAVLRYLEDAELRARHGAAGRARVEQDFRRELVWARWADFYDGLLAGFAAGNAGVSSVR